MESVRDLGVLLDSNLTLKNLIDNDVGIAGCHLRNIAFTKKHLDEESVKKLLINNIKSRVHYCHPVYYNLPKLQSRILQMALFSAARLSKGIPP